MLQHRSTNTTYNNVSYLLMQFLHLLKKLSIHVDLNISKLLLKIYWEIYIWLAGAKNLIQTGF